MKIIGIASLPAPAASRPAPQAAHNDQRVTAERAETAVAPIVAPSPPRTIQRSARPDAAFVTHLIATANDAPQTRLLRRATPADAMTRYRATGDAPTVSATTKLSRTA